MGWKDLWSKWTTKPAPERASDPAPAARKPPFPVLPAAENPWGVDVVDLRSVTHTLLSASENSQMAANSVSMARDDGRCFVGVAPEVGRVVDARLRYAIEGTIADGILFAPGVMEEKWGIYLHGGRVIVVRSWLRKVMVTADVSIEGNELVLGPIRGTLFGDEEPAMTLTLLDWLMRTHALSEDWPVPSPLPLDSPGETVAMLIFGQLGRLAAFAAFDPVPWRPPLRPLRTDSLLHVAIARGNLDDAAAQLDAGVPIGLLARDGLPPLTWALARPDLHALAFLLDRGSPVDVRSSEGATTLMSAVQSGSETPTRFLLDRGAGVNATDERGFTALHRAAEMNSPDIVQLLLHRGADATLQAMGYTARSLASARGHTNILEMLPQ